MDEASLSRLIRNRHNTAPNSVPFACLLWRLLEQFVLKYTIDHNGNAVKLDGVVTQW